MTEEETVDLSEMGFAEVQETMRENFLINATTKPWAWEWKYSMAHFMLHQGRAIFDVRKILGLTYPWLVKHKLIQWCEKYGHYIAIGDLAWQEQM